LSVGMVMSSAGVMAAWVMLRTGSIALGILAGVVIGVVAGIIQGILVGRFDLAPFAVTLVGMFVVGGLTMLMSQGATFAPTPDALTTWNFESVGPIPWPVIPVVVLFVLAQLTLTRTRWGREVLLVGSNIKASVVSGVNARRTLISVYAVAGVFSAFGGFFMTANLAGANADMAQPQLLNVVGAVALGGTSLFGGRGSVTRTAIGALLLGSIASGMNLLGLSSYDQEIVTGVVVALAVGIDALTHRTRS
ncbi:MAG: ABC transporter permease, partial [Micrococcales bacterium]|nr:ABC transporter permease [Micrococcales bacterium]